MAQALPLVRSLGSFSSWDEAADSVGGALSDWTATLQAWTQAGGLSAHAARTQQQQQAQAQQQAVQTGGGKDGGSTPLHTPGAPQDSAPEEAAWLGLKVVLQLLEVMPGVCEAMYYSLVFVVLFGIVAVYVTVLQDHCAAHAQV